MRKLFVFLLLYFFLSVAIADTPPTVISVNGKIGKVSLTTTDITEGLNLYYTQARFNSAFSAKTTDNLTQGSTNKYYATSLFNIDFGTKTTSNLGEGSNLYYLDSRARNAFSGLSPVSYNNSTGAISFLAPGSSGNVLTSNGSSWISSPPAAAGANTSLSNLSGTAINADLIPSFDSGFNLGTNSNNWANFHIRNIKYYGTIVLDASANQLYDAFGTLSIDFSSNTQTNFRNRILINVADPVNPQDAATKNYVDTHTGAPAWGTITGTLSNQTDLASALSGKEPTITSGTTSQYWRGDKSFQNLTTSVVTEGSNLYYLDSRVRSAISAIAPLSYNSGTGAFSIPVATSSQNGYLSSTDWSTFNNKQSTLTTGNLTDTGTDGISVTGGTGAVIGTGTSLSQQVSDTTHNGYLSSTDWTTFNNKAPLASPAFTGIPTAPTASVGTSTTQLATTAFVLSQGFQGATGSMPNASSASLVTTTSATTTFVTAITTPITVTASSAPVLAKCVLDMTSATAASVATMRVTVNGVSGGSVTESLTTATTQHLTVPNQNLSTALGPGTYTVNCDFNRASGTGTVTVGQGSLTAVALQGTESNGISQLTGLGLSAGPGSGLQSLSGILTMAGGGSNANLTASNGAIPYSTASALALLAPGTLGQILRSGGAAAPTWTAETFPASTTINQILYSSAANVVSGLATANTGALVTSSTGVPSIVACATANRLLRTNGTTMSCAQANLTTDVTGTLPFAQGGTGNTTFANQRIPFSNGTILTADGNFFYDTTNIRLAVGGNSTATIGAVTANGNVGFQSFCSGSNNCAQIRNQSAYNLAMLNANDANVLGILVGAERSRGTQAARTQALNNDIGLNLVGSCYTGAASSTGFTAQILYNSSEDCTSSANGGEMSFATTLNGTTTLVERARITNDGQSKFHYGVTLDTSTTQPSCDAAHRGLQWIIDGTTGVADIFQICQKTALDTYIWVTH